MSKKMDYIISNPEICGGQPVISGTRMRVRDILDLLAAGSSRKEILEDYPYLKDEHISAALQYAARQTGHPVITAAE